MSVDRRPLLEIEDLGVTFSSRGRQAAAVVGSSLSVYPGERVGLIGESGSGKTVTSLAVLRLLDSRVARIRPGSSIRFEGEDVLSLGRRELRALRGGRISMVFQDAMSSLNPVFTIGSQLEAVVKVHRDVSTREARTIVVEALRSVEITDPARQLDRYPHQLSGGMRQRVLIAMALACEPRLIIADEPTSGLDVTVQAAILETLLVAARDRNIAVLMITHDMGVVARFCERVYVMYSGRVVESARVSDAFYRPAHPYTAGLLRSTPRVLAPGQRQLIAIPGSAPVAGRELPGCSFAPRCPYAASECTSVVPPLVATGGPEHQAACLFAGKLALDGAARGVLDERHSRPHPSRSDPRPEETHT